MHTRACNAFFRLKIVIHVNSPMRQWIDRGLVRRPTMTQSLETVLRLHNKKIPLSAMEFSWTHKPLETNTIWWEMLLPRSKSLRLCWRKRPFPRDWIDWVECRWNRAKQISEIKANLLFTWRPIDRMAPLTYAANAFQSTRHCVQIQRTVEDARSISRWCCCRCVDISRFWWRCFNRCYGRHFSFLSTTKQRNESKRNKKRNQLSWNKWIRSGFGDLSAT